MKIIVKKEKERVISIPNWLIWNRFIFGMLLSYARKKNKKLATMDCVMIRKCVCKHFFHYQNIKVIEIEEGEENRIMIWI